MVHYDLETEKVIEYINKKNPRKVCIQLPDGLKPQAKNIVDQITSKTSAEVIIWAGSNFGSCDLALSAKQLNIDLLIHYGHTKWVFNETNE
ncbi:MAG: diphthamide synthesis protein [Nanobdellota archaeon]